MAGYDMWFYVTPDFRSKTQDFLKYIQSIYKRNGLRFNYRTNITSEDNVYVYITVDGPLPIMQHIHRILPEVFQYYSLVVTNKEWVTYSIFVPFYTANQDRLKIITEDIYAFSNFLNTNQIKNDPNPFVVSPSLTNQILKAKSRKGSQLTRDIINLYDSWCSGKIGKSGTLILCDKAIEDWLKYKLYSSKSGIGFIKTVDNACNEGIITRMERYKLLRIHGARSKVQHRGGTVRPQTVWNLFKIILGILNKHA